MGWKKKNSLLIKYWLAAKKKSHGLKLIWNSKECEFIFVCVYNMDNRQNIIILIKYGLLPSTFVFCFLKFLKVKISLKYI